MKVLYITGMGRSGSTILANLLGELNGFFSVGELHNLWWRGIIAGHECGCGQPLSQCDFWSRVLNDVQEAHDGRAATISRWQQQGLRLRHTHRLLRLRRLSSAPTPLRDYGNVLSDIYQRIGRVSGANVIVDSSKWPTAAALLQLLPGVEPYLVHLVRDPRAVAYSRRKVKKAGNREMRRRGPAFIASSWVLRNKLAEAVASAYPSHRRMVLRYEDLVADPRRTLTAVANMVREEVDSLPLTAQGAVRLNRNHNVAGNPARFTTGDVRIRPDSAWITEQDRWDRYVSSALTFPLLHRYGYALRVR